MNAYEMLEMRKLKNQLALAEAAIRESYNGSIPSAKYRILASREQLDEGYAVFGMLHNAPLLDIMHEPYELVAKLDNGQFLVIDPEWREKHKTREK